ncbi:hypothetical protein M9H77_02953 [Catharanthus roseus]|uniref:Uncharacterized protein n=1 Tax=Catharanthus roseus TaxID=4058 RepID=A0ACC0C9U9_CATRO|nr:hypothetical protein M9H77_02953 [Catharanthus roseus]
MSLKNCRTTNPTFNHAPLFIDVEAERAWASIDYGMWKFSSDDPVIDSGCTSVEPDLWHDLKLVLEATLICVDSLKLPSCTLNLHILFEPGGMTVGFVNLFCGIRGSSTLNTSISQLLITDSSEFTKFPKTMPIHSAVANLYLLCRHMINLYGHTQPV